MEQITNWKRQNIIQRYGRSIYEFFSPSNCNLETYRPKLSKLRVTTGLITAGILFSIPFFPDYLFWNKIGGFMIK